MLPGLRKNIALFEGSQASPVCPSHKTNIKMKMTVEPWGIDTRKVKQKYYEINVSQCHFVHYKYHKDKPGIEARFLR